MKVEPLAELLRDPHEGARQQAQMSLEQIGGEGVQEILERQKSRGFLDWLKGARKQ